MKVYVAAKFQQKARVRAIYDGLRAFGHTVTHDWTHEDEGERTGKELTDYLTRCAEDDVAGVKEADVIILLPHVGGRGLWVEFGLALSDPEKRIVVVHAPDVNCIFFNLPGVVIVETDQDAVNGAG